MNKLIRYIRYVNQILKGHIMNKNTPILVTLCVTNKCNLRCIYCYEEYYDRNHREFTTKEILSLIEELGKMGTKYISINGGEPLLRKDIEIIVDKVKEEKMLCHISTNGTLAKNNINVLKKIDSIGISIDGDKKNNDLNRGIDVYTKVIEAIECLKENRVKFHTHTVLTKNNKNAIDEMMKLALKYGFKAQFSPLRIEDSPDKNIGLNDNELKEIVEEILDYKKKGFPVFFSHNSYENLLNWPFSYNRRIISEDIPKNYKFIKCYIKRFSCHIEANGFVYPCIVLVNKFPALNFLEVGFKKAWENLEKNNCRACYNICCNDLNQIFGFKPEVIWNAFKIVMKRIF